MQALQSLAVSALSHDGRGIAFMPGAGLARGKAVFIPGALPGQQVECRVTRERGNYLEASLEAIVDPGPNTAPPLCPHGGQCGGCQLQTMPYERQLYWKKQNLWQNLLRIAHFTEEELNAAWQGLLPSPLESAYRNKIELAFGRDEKGRPCPGLRGHSSHAVFTLKKCALVDGEANELIQAMARALSGAFDLPAEFLRYLVLRSDQGQNQRKRWHALLISWPGDRTTCALVRKLADHMLRNTSLASFTHEIRASQSHVARGEKRLYSLTRQGEWPLDEPLLELPLGGRSFRVDIGSFFQVNDPGSQKLAGLVAGLDSQSGTGEALLDLYCGCGAPGLLLAPAYARSLGIENDSAAIHAARLNSKDLPLHSWKCADVGRTLAYLASQAKSSKWDAALADPPRSGMGGAAISALCRLAPRKIIMISCNSATFARDAAILKKSYRLQSLNAVDLFPQTAHLETCSLWIAK